MPHSDPAPCQVRLFRDNRGQVICVPAQLELPGSEAVISRDGDRLIVEPVRANGLTALLDSWEPLNEDFPEIADPPSAPEDIF